MSETLVIVGRGALAQIFFSKASEVAKLEGSSDVKCVAWSDRAKFSASLVLHVGSGRELPEVIAYCAKNAIPLVQASTGVAGPPEKNTDFSYIEAPNLSLPIIKMFRLLEGSAKLFKGCEIEIIESHQAAKTSVPGTAVRFAELLGGDKSKIKSLRDPEKQKEEFQIPDEYLEAHAAHKIFVRGQGGEIGFSTKVLGRETYIYGVLQILKNSHKLDKKTYFISDLISENII